MLTVTDSYQGSFTRFSEAYRVKSVGKQGQHNLTQSQSTQVGDRRLKIQIHNHLSTQALGNQFLPSREKRRQRLPCYLEAD